MTQTRPIAVGYVSARTANDRGRQLDALTGYAQTEGLRLTLLVPDPSGIWTISQLVKTARKHDAAVVLLPAGVHLAEAHARVSADLAGRDARCVVVDDASADQTPGGERPVARLSATLRRRETAPAPA